MFEFILMGATPSPTNQLIELVKTPIPIVETVQELTLEEKIASNFYNCDEMTHYIRADNAECLLKPVYVQPVAENTPQPIKNASGLATAPAGWYEAGSCTFGAWTLAPWIGRYKDAKTWDDMARAEGRTVSSVPIVGSVFVDNGGTYGHVGVVIAVSGDTVTVKDMNYRNKWEWTVRDVPAVRYVYIYP